MITCIIIDKEKSACEYLKKLISQYFKTKLIVLEAVDSFDKGVDAINRLQPELIFMDVEMKLKDGHQLIKQFNNFFYDIIFTTAQKEHAIEAIKHGAIDCLLKPIECDDLDAALKRLERKQSAVTNQQRINAMLQNLNSDGVEFNKIALPTSYGYALEKISNILYCEGEDNYTKIYTIDGKEILVTKTLKSIEGQFPDNVFKRIHKSYLVNLNYIDRFDRSDKNIIVLTNGKVLDVAHRKTRDFVNTILRRPLTKGTD
jgi:two-component system LytT family response regulator